MMKNWVIALLLIQSTLAAPGKFSPRLKLEENDAEFKLRQDKEIETTLVEKFEARSQEDGPIEESESGSLKQFEKLLRSKELNTFDQDDKLEEKNREIVDHEENLETFESKEDLETVSRQEEQMKFEDNGIKTRIIGGINALETEFPYLVSIQVQEIFGMSHICGGVILSNHHILTTAQCVKSQAPSNIMVVAGISNLSDTVGPRQVKSVSIITLHPNYNSGAYSNNNDIAIVQLTEALVFNDDVTTIRMAIAVAEVSTECQMAGWGATEENGVYSNELKKMTVSVVSDDECESTYGAGKIMYDSMICAADKDNIQDFCQGDEGGPLTCHGVLHGIASWGYGCGRGYPGVYTQVIHFKDWIEAQMQS